MLLAFEEESPVGFAVYFYSFSTWLGRPGLYLEDLFVNPEKRGKGYGRALLVELAKIARDRGCGRMEWAVLNWNEPAIKFYQALGAKPMNEWTVFRLTVMRLREWRMRPTRPPLQRRRSRNRSKSKTNSKSRIERNPPSPRLRRGSSRFAGEEEEEE